MSDGLPGYDAWKELSKMPVSECEGRPIVKPDDPLWEACQRFVMSLAEDPALGQPAELHFWGLLKIRVYDFAVRELAEHLEQRERDAKREEQAWRRGFAAYRDAQREEVWFQDNERTVLCQKCGSPVVFIVRGAPEPKR